MQAQADAASILVCEAELLEEQSYLAVPARRLGYSVELAHDIDAALCQLASSLPGIAAVLVDLSDAAFSGMEILREIRSMDPDLPIIAVASSPTPNEVVVAMKSGATDFLSRTLNPC